MNTKPLETPLDQFTEEEIEEMDDDEQFARAVWTVGDLGDLAVGMAAQTAKDVMEAIKMGRAFSEAVLAAGNDVDASEAAGAIAPMVGELILSSILTTVMVGRKIEAFASANPSYPDTDPVDVLLRASDDASPDESV